MENPIKVTEINGYECSLSYILRDLHGGETNGPTFQHALNLCPNIPRSGEILHHESRRYKINTVEHKYLIVDGVDRAATVIRHLVMVTANEMVGA
jgi:hypothetical protein